VPGAWPAGARKVQVAKTIGADGAGSDTLMIPPGGSGHSGVAVPGARYVGRLATTQALR
jgi:hypothetical protein